MKIDFQFETEYGVFSDALWFADDASMPTDAEIEAAKQQRLNNWLAIVAPTPVIEQSPVQ